MMEVDRQPCRSTDPVPTAEPDVISSDPDQSEEASARGQRTSAGMSSSLVDEVIHSENNRYVESMVSDAL